jgi:hypothetical protein
MRITIKSPDFKTIRLIFPTKLLFNTLTARIGCGIINKYVPSDEIKLSSQDLRRLSKEIIRIKKKYPDLILVDVVSGDGEQVQIKL